MEITPVSAVLGASGACPEITVGGKSYRLGHPTQAAKSRYCEALVTLEAGKIEIAKKLGLESPDELAARKDKLYGEVSRQEHQPGGTLFDSYSSGVNREVGARLFLWSLIAENHPDLPMAAGLKIVASGDPSVELALRQVVPDFFDFATEGKAIPPDKRETARLELVAGMDAELNKLRKPTS